MDLLHKYCPFIASIAASDASKEAKLMNAYPFEFPVSGSLIICKEKKIIINLTIIQEYTLITISSFKKCKSISENYCFNINCKSKLAQNLEPL